MENKEIVSPFRIIFLIGNGSRLPNILEKISSHPDIAVPLVVSHRKPPEGEEDTVGIAKTKTLGIPAVYWNLIQMRNADRNIFAHPASNGQWHEERYREDFMRFLGEFLMQQYYKPNLIMMTGWNLVLDDNFMGFFQKAGIPVINVHPHPLPEKEEEEIEAPDGTKVKVLRGTEVWVAAVEQKLPWSGVTIHQVIPEVYDVGKVVAREWVKIAPQDTVETLREKLNEVEDRLVPETLLKIAKGEIHL